MDYVSWQNMGTPYSPYTGASPNVKLIMTELIRKFGGANWGIYVYRAVRGGTSWSTHAWGGAGDWAYQTDAAARLAAINWLIEYHIALHVQMIVDENNNRTWKCWRDELNGPGWKPGVITTGGPWLHFETTPNGWGDTQPIANRPGMTAAPTPQPIPPINPMEDDMLRLIQPTTDAAIFLLDGLICTWVQNGNVYNALSSLVAPGGAVQLDRLALKALELHGPAPIYSGTPANQPGRTVPADFAVHRP